MTNAMTTIVGNLTADPVLRRTNGLGLPVANFTVAHTPRAKNSETGQYEDSGPTLFVKVTCWRELAENVAASLHKGDSVVVIGGLGIRHWETEDSKGSEVICAAEQVSVDLRWATADVKRVQKHASDDGAEAWAPRAVTTAAA